MSDALKVIDELIEEYSGGGIQQAVLVQARARIAALSRHAGPSGGQTADELLKEAYELFTVEDYDIGTDEWAWVEKTRYFFYPPPATPNPERKS